MWFKNYTKGEERETISIIQKLGVSLLSLWMMMKNLSEADLTINEWEATYHDAVFVKNLFQLSLVFRFLEFMLLSLSDTVWKGDVCSETRQRTPFLPNHEGVSIVDIVCLIFSLREFCVFLHLSSSRLSDRHEQDDLVKKTHWKGMKHDTTFSRMKKVESLTVLDVPSSSLFSFSRLLLDAKRGSVVVVTRHIFFFSFVFLSILPGKRETRQDTKVN